MTKEEIIKIVRSNTEASWQTVNIIEAIESYEQDIRAEVIDKCIKLIKEHSGEHYIDCDGYFGGQLELVFKVDDWINDLEQLKKK